MAADCRHYGNRFALIRLSDERKCQVTQDVEEMSWPSRSFYLLVILSATIASYGLLSDSTAIVIGAMLVAPLMGPIFGIALSITTSNRSLLKGAIVSETIGVALAVGVPLVIGLLPLRTPLGPEVLSRTEPTLYDILVAVAAGLAGAYAVANPKISPALPGVAISTSLVPPLAACGLCLSDARWEQAMGAFLLFFANFVAIEISAGAVFVMSGLEDMSARSGAHAREIVRRFAPSLVILILTAVFMTHTLIGIVEDRRKADAVESNLARQMSGITGVSIADVSLQESRNGTSVVAVVLTPQQIEPETVKALEDRLREQVDAHIRLKVRSLISSDFDANGPVFVDPEVSRSRREEAQVRRILDTARSTINAKLRDIPGARLIDLQREDQNGSSTLRAVVRAPTFIGSTQVAQMQNALEQREKQPVRLLVRSVYAKDVDAHGPLYARPAPVLHVTPYEKWLRKRLGSGLRSQLSRLHPGAEVTETIVKSRNGRLIVIAEARAPTGISVADVDAMQSALRKHVHPNIDLVVRSSVGADVSSQGYMGKQNIDRLIGR